MDLCTYNRQQILKHWKCYNIQPQLYFSCTVLVIFLCQEVFWAWSCHHGEYGSWCLWCGSTAAVLKEFLKANRQGSGTRLYQFTLLSARFPDLHGCLLIGSQRRSDRSSGYKGQAGAKKVRLVKQTLSGVDKKRISFKQIEINKRIMIKCSKMWFKLICCVA